MDELMNKEDIKIENLIYDSDLARLYKCKNGTKTINLSVKRHINRFPERFMFQLSEEEYKSLRFQTETTNNMSRTLPYVFTEQGVAMLATILRTEIAEEISIKIMDAFVSMRHYIGHSEYRLTNIESKIIEHDTEIKLLQESFDKLDEKKKETEIYFNGQIFDAYSMIYEIFNSAKNSLIIIDAYADNTILDIIKRLKIEVTLITKQNNLLTEQDIERYKKQYNNLKVIYDNTFHDRYFILDKEILYHCGTSINRIGYKTFSITKVNDIDVFDSLLKKIKL